MRYFLNKIRFDFGRKKTLLLIEACRQLIQQHDTHKCFHEAFTVQIEQKVLTTCYDEPWAIFVRANATIFYIHPALRRL